MSEPQDSFVDEGTDFDETRSWHTGDDQTLISDEQTETPAYQASWPAQRSTAELRQQWEAFYADLAQRTHRTQQPTAKSGYPYRHPGHCPYGLTPTSNLIIYGDENMGRAGNSRATHGDCPKSPTLTYGTLRPGSLITITNTWESFREDRTPDAPVHSAIAYTRDAMKDGVRGGSRSCDHLVVRVLKESMIVVPVGGERRPPAGQHDPLASIKLYESDFPLFPDSCVYLSAFVIPFSLDISIYGVLSDEGMCILRAAWLNVFNQSIETVGDGPSLLKRLKSSRLGRLGQKLTSGKSKEKSS